ncbi:MAG TPA: SDR family NAD(P)-dependent oxidoreductase [Solirubrobacteraceae bacterium]|jgi:2-hydroxycyclohexanecarboxyl-CoA dehydrogenase
MASPAASRRVALVTGAGRGIGRAVAGALAADGHLVAIADIDASAVERAAGELNGLAVALDVTDTGSVAAAVTNVEDRAGPIEILVNNAGWDEFHPFLETDEPFWDRVIEINLKGCLRLCHRVVPSMVAAERGRVVNIASDAARVGSSLEAVYSGAKGGVVAFTKTLAREVARHQVTVNAVCPGPTQTAMLEQMAGAGDRGANVIEAMRRAVPMRRLGTPDDIAAAVAFLASDRAGFITGQTLSVSGGLTMA